MGPGEAVGLFVGLALVFGITGALSARGPLPRNPVVGIRIPSTHRSDDAWLDGHAAAAPLMILMALVNAVFAAAIIGLSPGRPTTGVLVGADVAFVLAGVIVSTVVADRAAKGR